MKEFKFFQKGTLDDPQMLDELTRATASFNADTPQSYMGRRMLYHTNRDAYDRLRNPFNNNEMERYYYDHGLGRFETARPTELTRQQIEDEDRRERMIRRLNGSEHRDNHGNTDYVPFFTGGPRVTRVNPKWWMKIKMFFQEMKIKMFIEDNGDMLGIIFFSISITTCFGLIIGKILNVW